MQTKEGCRAESKQAHSECCHTLHRSHCTYSLYSPPSSLVAPHTHCTTSVVSSPASSSEPSGGMAKAAGDPLAAGSPPVAGDLRLEVLDGEMEVSG